MDQDTAIPSRVIIELRSGQRFATFWSTRSADPTAAPLRDLFTGRLVARIVGSEDYIPAPQISRVLEEIMREPEGDQCKRIMLQRRAPNITPKKRTLLPGAAKFADSLKGMTLERVDDIIDNPSTTWAGWNGATVYSDGEFQVVVGERWSDTDCVMHISRDGPSTRNEQSSAPTTDRRRVSGRKADLRRPVPKTVPEFLDRLKEYGFEIDDSRRHYSISHPKKPGVATPFPRTPSDHRWAGNQVAQLKQTFGIDIRKPLD